MAQTPDVKLGTKTTTFIRHLAIDEEDKFSTDVPPIFLDYVADDFGLLLAAMIRSRIPPSLEKSRSSCFFSKGPQSN